MDVMDCFESVQNKSEKKGGVFPPSSFFFIIGVAVMDRIHHIHHTPQKGGDYRMSILAAWEDTMYWGKCL